METISFVRLENWKFKKAWVNKSLTSHKVNVLSEDKDIIIPLLKS